MRAFRSLVRCFQFLHAWLLSRTLIGTCARIDPLDASSILVIAPHPDDETLGCGGLIARKRAAGGTVSIVFLTDGGAGTIHPDAAPDAHLCERRRLEAMAASAQLGVPASHLHFFHCPDGQLESLSPTDRNSIVDRYRRSGDHFGTKALGLVRA